MKKTLSIGLLALALCAVMPAASQAARVSVGIGIGGGGYYGGPGYYGPAYYPGYYPPAYYVAPPPVVYAPPPVYATPIAPQVVYQAAPSSVVADQTSPTFTDENGRTCREYQANATVAGGPGQAYGTACLQPDGTWRITR